MKLHYIKLYVVLLGVMTFFTNCNKKDNPEILAGNWNFYYSEKFILNGKKLKEKAEGEMKFEYSGTGNVVDNTNGYQDNFKWKINKDELHMQFEKEDEHSYAIISNENGVIELKEIANGQQENPDVTIKLIQKMDSIN